MTNAMAKALVNGLEGEGFDQIWSKLSKKNTVGYEKEKHIENRLFFIDPGAYLKRGRKRKLYRDPNQLSLFDDI